ncbi:MAG: surface protein [Flavipsychrobacter sp.]|nr:surface protein [Flavipsychrobacter sp.]
MKKSFILYPLLGLLIYVVMSSYSSGPGIFGYERSGATGSPGCAGSGCHASVATATTTVSITLLSSGTPVTTYTAGGSYTIRITGTQTSSSFTLPSFGYQVTAVKDVSGTPTSVGTLSAPSGSHLTTISGIKVIEHSSPITATSGSGGSGTTYVVNVPWTAPVANTGCVTLYGVVNAVNGNFTADAGDLWNNTSLVINEAVASITGTTSACVGATTTLSDATPCGIWTTSTSSVATVGSSSGTVTGVSPGTTTISYTAGAGNTATTTVTVFPAPASISGNPFACLGLTTGLSDASGAGTWTSTNTSVATVVSGSGVVTGVSTGTSTISFKLTSTGCTTSTPVTVNPLPNPISGSLNLCVSSNTQLTDAGGGTWTSGNTSVATIVPGTGLASGVAAGTANITYTLGTGCTTIAIVTVNPLPPAISGTSLVCPLSSITLSDASSPGTWNTANTTIATVGTGSGIVTGVAGGTATITFTAGTGCTATTIVTVTPAPPVITGTLQVCVGLTTNLTDANTTGTWTSGNSSIATVGIVSGLVNGIAAGTAVITYTLPTTGCITLATVTVNPLPTSIVGPTQVCEGFAVALTDLTTGGTWASSSTSVAVVNSTGNVSGLVAGTTTITYKLTTSCIATTLFTVDPLPAPISGSANVCSGSTTTLSDAGGGTWTSGNTSNATVGSSSGIVTALSFAGNANITYTLPGTGCKTSVTVTINPVPAAIVGVSGFCDGTSAQFSDATTGGTWSSSTTTIAFITSGGLAVGVSSGTTTITYTRPITGCIAVKTVTVFPIASPITGSTLTCVTSTIALSDASSSGTWTSGTSSVATVGAGSGIVTGVSPGTSVISYTLSTGCFATKIVTINPLPAAITGSLAACTGVTSNLSDATSGGTWTSTNTSVASIGLFSGLLSGLTVGTTTISYSMGVGCAVSKIATVNLSPGAITGSTFLCRGLTTSLSDAGGGTWSSSNSSIAAANVSTGVITGNGTGTATITYTLSTGCKATTLVTVNPLSPITGITSLCAGLTTTLSDGTIGGTWTSTNTSVATINPTSGFLTSSTSGNTTINYTLSSGCVASTTVSIVSAPSAITGNTSVCLTGTSALSDGGGGTWASSNTAIARVGISTGIVTGFGLGTATITYSLGTGCTVTTIVTVNPMPAAITGPTSVCEGGTITLSDPTPGGTWSSGNTNAFVTLSGAVTGVAAGSATISWTLPTGCAAFAAININPAPGPITGSLAICKGLTSTLSDAGGGTWTSSTSSVATIGFSSGIATGVNVGTAVITYTLPTTGCTTMAIVTVNPIPGAITGTGVVCTGATMALSDAGGGTWTSSNTNSSVDINTGVVTGVNAGSSVITYTLATGCRITKTVTINPSPAAITGSSSICESFIATLSDATTPGTWSSSNTVIAAINPTSGVILAFAPGTSVIAYTRSNGCQSLLTLTVNQLPAAITGGTRICTSATSALSDSPTGGTWTSSNSSVATINATSGLVAALTPGNSVINYTLATGCATSTVITVVPPPTVITGPANVCVGSSAAFSNTILGGTWSSSNTAAATVGSSTGMVSGLAFGTTTITYTSAPGCATWTTIAVDTLPSVIIGTAVICTGNTASLTDATTGGTWSSSNTTIATAGSSSGIIAGIVTGTATITYTLPTGCATTLALKVNPSPAAVTGTPQVCAGFTTVLGDPTPGGSWSSATTTVASVSGGTVSGITAGTSVIAYTLTTGCSASVVVTVNPLPAPITGGSRVCVAASLNLSDATSGGNWTSSNTIVATVSGTGVLAGISSSTTTITYTLGTGCRSTLLVTVDPLPFAGTTVGVSYTCAGSPVTLLNSTPGGAWSSSNTSIATVDPTGTVTAVSAGIVTISYSVTNICGTANALFTDTIYAPPSGGTIAGATSVCEGSTIVLTDPLAGGSWSSSNTGIATVSGGTVTGVSAGVATISYTISTVCGSASATLSVTVNSFASCHVGINPVTVADGFRVYPNPTTGSFVVELPATANGATITVMDMLGKTIDTKNTNGANAQQVSFDLGRYPRGSYVVKVNAGTVTFRQKIELW